MNNNNNNQRRTTTTTPFSSPFTPAASASAAGRGTTGASSQPSQKMQSKQPQPQTLLQHGGSNKSTNNWNGIQTCMDLQRACQILTDRCLKLSAKWIAEQWIGLPPETLQEAAASVQSTTSPQNSHIPEIYWNNSTQTNNASIMYARTLLNLGEYAHAAAILSETSLLNQSATIEQIPPLSHEFLICQEDSNEEDNSYNTKQKLAIYYRAYSMYMAGEQRREEEVVEDQMNNNNIDGSSPTSVVATVGTGGGGGPKHALASKNPYLPQLAEELLDAYNNHGLDAFGKHVYGMVLKNLSTPPPQGSPPAYKVLVESILEFPYNWSAWLDLAQVLLLQASQSQNNNNTTASSENNKQTMMMLVPDASSGVDVVDEMTHDLQEQLGNHFMYHFFCAHVQHEHYQNHIEAKTMYEQWMDVQLFGGSSYLLSQHANCNYHLREMTHARSLLEDLHFHMPYRLDHMDVLSNIYYVQEDSVALCQLAHTATQVDKYRPETCCIVGNYYSLKQQRAKAIQYFQRALMMDRTFNSAWTLMGHEYVEWKQTANAMECYRRAVQVTPGDYRAWYGLGQTYELLNMNLYALYYYKQAAQLRPYDARMWCAVGMSYAILKRTKDAIRAYERALFQANLNNGEEDGSYYNAGGDNGDASMATQKLAALYRQEGEIEKAAECYMRHLETQHHLAGPARGGDSVTLEKMIQSLVVDSIEAEALLFLANYHRDNGLYDLAGVFCSRLLDYPGPEKEQAKGLLKELRSRKSKAKASRVRSSSTVHTRSKGPVQDTYEFPT